jgi:hypothetical protein
MLILISLAPAYFAINPAANLADVRMNIEVVQEKFDTIDISKVSETDKIIIEETKSSISAIEAIL